MDNGDGSSTDGNGDIWDNSTGAWVGYENGDGTWTDQNGQDYTANNLPITDGYIDNGDGTYTSIYTGETVQGGGDVGNDVPFENAGLIDNGDGTFTNPTTGSLIYPNGDVEHADGTWTFYDGTTYDPILGADPTTDDILRKAGAAPIGGPIGASRAGNAANGQQNNSSVQSALTSLANLLKQAQTSNNAAQLAAIRTAQQRLGALPAASTLSSTAKIAIAGGALLALYAISQRRRVA